VETGSQQELKKGPGEFNKEMATTMHLRKREIQRHGGTMWFLEITNLLGVNLRIRGGELRTSIV